MTKMPYAEPWRVKMVEPLRKLSKDERVAKIAAADYNLFALNAEDVFIDLITDSGTGAMSDRQWSALMTGDESYAGSKSFLKMKATITQLLGFEYVLPTHQGRAAENVLFSATIKAGDYVPGNAHFDTTKGHIEYRQANCVDCTIQVPEAENKNHPFKGNIDIDKLEAAIAQYGVEKIPMVILTVTCNTGGGQPVSMQNMREVSAVCKKHGIPLFYDSARFAENAYFIKVREPGYRDKSIREIVKEMYSYADGMTMSSKKDAIVNIGGFIAVNSEKLYRECCTFGIIFEGFVSYGGMSGRDMEALAAGLIEGTEYDYLEARISQVKYLGDLIMDLGIPIVEPTGGHAVYVDAQAFFPQIPPTQYPAQVLGVALYEEAGVRGVEIGTVLADRDPVSRQERPPKMELLRLAIPRRVYTNNHMQVVAWGLGQIWQKRETYTGLRITWEAPIMRHFTARFAKL